MPYFQEIMKLFRKSILLPLFAFVYSRFWNEFIYIYERLKRIPFTSRSNASPGLHSAKIYYLSEYDMSDNTSKAIDALYRKRALPIYDMMLQSSMSRKETIAVIDKLSLHGFVKTSYDNTVVSLTKRGRKAGTLAIKSIIG